MKKLYSAVDMNKKAKNKPGVKSKQKTVNRIESNLKKAQTKLKASKKKEISKFKKQNKTWKAQNVREAKRMAKNKY